MHKVHYRSQTRGATRRDNTAHGKTVQVRADFPTHGNNFVTVARPDQAQDMLDFAEAFGVYHDMVYCLDLFTKSLEAGK